MKKTGTPKFAHLQYEVLHELEISISEYWYLDMVFQLSRFGWCNKKLENIATDMRMSRRGVITMRDRLIEKGLITKGVGNRVRTSDKVNKVYFSENDYKKSAQSSKKVHKVHSKSAQSVSKTSVENNKRITKNRDSKELDMRGSIPPERFAEMKAKLMSKIS